MDSRDDFAVNMKRIIFSFQNWNEFLGQICFENLTAFRDNATAAVYLVFQGTAHSRRDISQETPVFIPK